MNFGTANSDYILSLTADCERKRINTRQSGVSPRGVCYEVRLLDLTYFSSYYLDIDPFFVRFRVYISVWRVSLIETNLLQYIP